MNKQRIAGMFFTKKEPANMDKRRTMDIKFREASLSELRKELNVADINSLPDGFIAGWASTDDIDHIGDKVLPGAFTEAISSKGLNGPKGIKLLAQHNSSQPAGKITKLEERGNGLWIEAQLNLKISYVQDLYEAAKDMGGLSFSIGYRLVENGFKFVDTGDSMTSYWELSKLDLHEVSVVTFPCNEEATMVLIKGVSDFDEFETLADLEKALVADGIFKSRNMASALTRAVKRLVSKSAPSEEPMVASKKDLEGIGTQLKALKDIFST